MRIRLAKAAAAAALVAAALLAAPLQASAAEPADAVAVADGIVSSYRSLWTTLTEAETFAASESWRITERVQRLNALGFDIGFNARYLMDILAQIEGDEVEVHLADAAAPTLIRENDTASALYVLMPMRV